MTELEKLFNKFCGTDSLRPVFHEPREFNGKIYATDAHVLIRIKKEDCDFEVENGGEKIPNYENVIPVSNCNEVLSVNKSDFEKYKIEDEYEVLEDEKECETCHGDGQVEWEYYGYTKDDDCPVCEGGGVEESEVKRKTGLKTYGNQKVKIKDTYCDIKLFSILFDVQEVQETDIVLIHQSGQKSLLFKVGSCEVLIMPLHSCDEGEVIKLL